MTNFSAWSVCTLLGVALCAPFGVRAASIPWHRDRFDYVTQGSRVDDTLNLFAAVEQLPIRLVASAGGAEALDAVGDAGRVSGDNGVDGADMADSAGDLDGALAAARSDGLYGTVRGRFAMQPARFLDIVCASHGLVWYYDGAVLQISSKADERSVAIQTHYLRAEALRDALQHVGVIDSHFPAKIDRDAETVIVQGPVTYLDRVMTAAKQLEDHARDDTPTTARVVRLTRATAADQRTDIAGHIVIVPGVATQLARRFNPVQVHVYGTPQRVMFDARLPIIEADAATNSVLIRDKPERIDGDAVLVSDMDVQARAVVVETWVVDVDAQALPSLTSLDGLAPLTPLTTMSAATDAPAVTSATAATSATTTTATTPAAPLLPPQPRPAARPSVLFGTMTDGASALMTQLAALETHGRAHVVVSHDAVTMDRTPAVIDRREAVLEQKIAGGDTSLDALAAAQASTGGLWLSVRPTIGGAGTHPPIALDVDAGNGRHVGADVASGQGLVMTMPGAGADANVDGTATRYR